MKRLGALSAAMIDSMIPLDGIVTIEYNQSVREKKSWRLVARVTRDLPHTKKATADTTGRPVL